MQRSDELVSLSCEAELFSSDVLFVAKFRKKLTRCINYRMILYAPNVFAVASTNFVLLQRSSLTVASVSL